MPGVFLQFGPYPTHEFQRISNVLPPGSMIDSDLARMVGATFVAGSKEDLDNLKELFKPAALKMVRDQNPYLPDAAVQWLASGERGVSSNFIFTTITGIDAMERFDPGRACHPFDCDDFRRCQLLLESVPEVANEFKTKMPVASGSDIWANLVRNWDAIVWSMDRECPDWRVRLSTPMPVSVRMIRSIVRNGESCVCRVCGGPMKIGAAILQSTITSGEGTCSPGGPGHLIGCMKCTECGHSY